MRVSMYICENESVSVYVWRDNPHIKKKSGSNHWKSPKWETRKGST